jgi:glycosyltransferase involved in cell wall biosynthesis
MNNAQKVLVCQRGARHRYAIPRLFEEADMLTALYTDSTAYSPMGRLATALHEAGVNFGRLQALNARKPEGIPLEKIFSSDRAFYAALLGMETHSRLSSAYIRQGLRGAGLVYSMYGEDDKFLEWAKSKGCKIAVDVFVHPDTLRIVAEESLRCTGEEGASARWIKGHREFSRNIFTLANTVVCPSEWVASGVREMFPEHTHKIRIVPYGSSVVREDKINTQSEPGRILFAGRDALRKGLHYLADAARQIRQRGHAIDVRVAGIDTEQLSWMPHADELNCLGTLPMDSMKEEFNQADLCVLPSLSEGQAGVLLEAMACGCPVIATRESGVDFADGCGITVPTRDSNALADEIYGVIADRGKRNALAEGALRQSGEYTMDAWKQRLVETMKEVAASG